MNKSLFISFLFCPERFEPLKADKRPVSKKTGGFSPGFMDNLSVLYKILILCSYPLKSGQVCLKCKS
ncbi:hypothetical protein B4135_3913 [Caldibacillus debilis]|uniref:Uncharacterized protein n=1 Tax=Caldibacillus debilis TaxID=301148 RepID=A0A150LB92_9BACI|nr:hypothetical protein B4135_3913 [Caldibacillus debilis]